MSPLLDSVKDLSVLLVGETIVDEYVYVYPMAKSPKENVIATREDRREEYHGGVQVPAKILKTLCGRVDVVTQPWEIRKTRFVDHSYMRKLFETYRMGTAEPSILTEIPDLSTYDLVLVFDFGHGFITESMVDTLCREAKFLAVNTQSNSGNMGYNFIHKYHAADLVCIDEPEARLAAVDRDSKMRTVIETLNGTNGNGVRKVIDCQRFIITHGKYGCMVYDDGRYSTVPAITQNVVDTVGAGDTFLSFAAPLAAAGARLEEAAFIGNIAGALKTSIIGHSDYVKKENVETWLTQNGI